MIRTQASHFVSHHLPDAGAGQCALDLACGKGRHTILLLERGYTVTALDRDVSELEGAEELTLMAHDLEEAGGNWPFRAQQFDVVLVVNYLWRPLLSDILEAVKPGGLLIYETFRAGQETVGRPRNPDFLLKEGELQSLCSTGFEVIDYFDGQDQDSGNFRQRICAKRL